MASGISSDGKTDRLRWGTGLHRPTGCGGLGCALLAALFLGTAVLGGTGVGCAGRPPPGVIHHVRAGENLYRIGLRYGVDARAIARANGIRDVTALRVGERLFIPRPRHAGAVAARPDHDESSASRLRADRGSPTPAAIRPSRERLFHWPLHGRLSSGFGARRGRHHEGIDIAAPRGTTIHAAAPGRVLFSGRMRGYGRVVIVKHAGRYRTVYAHASRLLVRKGQFVEAGQKIAEVGSSGRSTGPHLHFEVRRGETPQNPLAYLR